MALSDDVPTPEDNSIDITSKEYAESLDSSDPLSHFRAEFLIPTLADLKRPTLKISPEEPPSPPCTYLCGNSLGLQPRRTKQVIDAYLQQWQSKGVLGHWFEHSDSPVAPFLHTDDHLSKLMAPLVGASESEVAVMGSLTGNQHMLMASFFRPEANGQGRWKVLLEGKAFPSDHYAIQSQFVMHGLDPKEGMILLEPEDSNTSIITTDQILRAIDEHASELALVMLPGVQYYTAQFFDMEKITAHAHSHGIMVGWQLAHAAGNVPLKLHDWNIDFAIWCTYKYINAGPGGMAGIFVHEKYGRVDLDDPDNKYWPRLSGWWGNDKPTRFNMEPQFVPRPGAAGFQVSNPCALEHAALVATLQIFNETSMDALRTKSLLMTGYLEQLLDSINSRGTTYFTVVTPRDPKQRGAQISILLRQSGMMDKIMEVLTEEGVIVDERKPDVLRVAPVPLYNTFVDIWKFYQVFQDACHRSFSN